MDLDQRAGRICFPLRARDAKFATLRDTVFAAAGMEVTTPPRLRPARWYE